MHNQGDRFHENTQDWWTKCAIHVFISDSTGVNKTLCWFVEGSAVLMTGVNGWLYQPTMRVKDPTLEIQTYCEH